MAPMQCWRLASLETHGDRREVAEVGVFEQTDTETITSGGDSGAAISVICKNVATDYARCSGPTRRITDCREREVEVLRLRKGVAKEELALYSRTSLLKTSEQQ